MNYLSGWTLPLLLHRLLKATLSPSYPATRKQKKNNFCFWRITFPYRNGIYIMQPTQLPKGFGILWSELAFIVIILCFKKKKLNKTNRTTRCDNHNVTKSITWKYIKRKNVNFILTFAIAITWHTAYTYEKKVFNSSSTTKNKCLWIECVIWLCAYLLLNSIFSPWLILPFAKSFWIE